MARRGKRNRRTGRRVAYIAAALAVLATACGGAEGDGDGNADRSAGDRTELIILAEDIPAGLNYDGPAVGIPTSQTGIVNLMEGLIAYAPAGTNDQGVGLLDFSSYEGRLAESWEFDEASLTWTFHLRHDVVGCDGATFDADDVLYTFARAKSATGEVPVGQFEFSTAGVEDFDESNFEGNTELGDEVRRVDDFTVEVRQSEPASQLFLPVLAQWAGVMIFDKETMEEHATDEDPWSHDYANNENAPSFGPYCLERWVKDQEFVVVANPDYYRGAPDFERVVYRKVPQSANRVAALRSGEAHLVEHLTPREYEALREEEGIEVSGVIGNETLFLHLDWGTPPFDDPVVRRALAYALPYDEIIETSYFGNAQRWEGQIPSTYPGFHRADTQYDHDSEQAAGLLADAGFPDGQGLDELPAEAFQLTYVAEKESVLGPIATLVRSALQEIGIPVELNPIPQTQFADRLYTQRDLPMALDDQEKAVPVDGGYALLIAHTTYGCCANNNNFADPDVDDLVQRANVETDPERRDALLAEAQEILMGYPNLIPIAEWTTQWAHLDSIGDLTWHPENSLRWFELSHD
jgi:peptide/nickel transport system substrate-binding protein